MALQKYFYNELEAGCDEAGRGCLAGPVVAAAVILGKDYNPKSLNDSKKLSKKQRRLLRIEIEQNAQSWAVGIVNPKKIDEVNILQASLLAMHKAVSQLSVLPSFLLIDGNRFLSYKNLEHKCIVKGDAKFMNIAAASILAKTHRDELMQNLDKKFPMYDWYNNKGYPTKHHRLAIAKFGACEHHRKSFRLLSKQYQLDL